MNEQRPNVPGDGDGAAPGTAPLPGSYFRVLEMAEAELAYIQSSSDSAAHRHAYDYMTRHGFTWSPVDIVKAVRAQNAVPVEMPDMQDRVRALEREVSELRAAVNFLRGYDPRKTTRPRFVVSNGECRNE